MFKKMTTGLSVLACLMGAGDLRAAPGDLDSSFDGDGVALIDFSGTEDFADAVEVLPDGRILVGGSTNGMQQILALALLDANGVLDTSFNDDGLFTTDPTEFGSGIKDLAVDTEGRLLALGSISPDLALLRLNTDGTLDASFDGGLVRIGTGGFSNHATSILLQPDGKVVIAGDELDQFLLARFNADGTPDLGFSGDGFSDELVPGGASAALVRIFLDGDKIVAIGRTSIGNDVVAARYESDGDLDLSFDGDGFDTYDGGGLSLIRDVVRLPDGKFLIGGEFNTDLGFVRLNADLTLDTDFGVGGTLDHDFPAVINESLGGMAVQANGKIVAAVTSGSGLAQVAMAARFNPDGSIDTGFGVGGLATADFLPGFQNGTDAIALQTDGKIVVAGSADGASGNDFGVARLIGDEADLSLSKTVDDASVETGATVTFTLSVSHASGSEAGDVQVVDTLPAGLTFVSATPSQGTCSGTTTVTCALGTMESGDSATVTLVTTAAAAGTAVNTSSVSAQAVETNPADNTATASVTATSPPPPPPPSTSGGCSLVRSTEAP